MSNRCRLIDVYISTVLIRCRINVDKSTSKFRLCPLGLVPGSVPGRAQKFVSVAARSITAADLWAGAVDFEDLAVSSDHGNI